MLKIFEFQLEKRHGRRRRLKFQSAFYFLFFKKIRNSAYPDPISDCKYLYFIFLWFYKKSTEARHKNIQHDVKFRLTEIVLICDLDYLIKHHLDNNESSQNEVERVQSYVENTICDEGSLE